MGWVKTGRRTETVAVRAETDVEAEGVCQS
mgnify:CR=1 FL=1